MSLTCFVCAGGVIGPLSLPHLRRPPVDAVSSSSNFETLDAQTLHSWRILQPNMSSHATRVGTFIRYQLEHRRQEICNALCFIFFEMIFLAKNIRERPVPQSMNVAQLSFTIEDFLTPFAAQTH